MQTHDFISDESRRHLLRIDDTLTAPDFVKESSVDAEAVAGLPPWQFALPDQRRFPMDTPGHVWLSFAYAKSAGVQAPGLQERLRQAAESFGIAADIQKIDEAFAQPVKAAHAPRFAVTVDFGPGDAAAEQPLVKQGGVHGFYPMNDRFELEASARQLQDDCFRVPAELYVEGCRNLVKAAAEYTGCRLPSTVRFYGEERLPDLARLQQQAVKSQALTKDAGYADLVRQVENAYDAFDVAEIQKCADAWMAKDREHFGPPRLEKMESIYSAFQTGPLAQSVRESLDKWASIAGAMLPRHELAAVSEETLAARFTKAAADQLRPIVKAAAEKSHEVQAMINQLDAGLQQEFARLVVRGA